MEFESLIKPKPLSERGSLILLAAQKLFLEHGFDNTSLEMIISESGGSRRNIYAEFGNKKGLLIAVMREQVAAQVNLLLEIDYGLPPKEALQQVCSRFMQGMLSETLIGLFRLVTQIVPSVPEVGELIFKYGPLTGCRPVSVYLDHLNEKGTLDVDDSDYAAQLLMEMVKARLHLQAILVPNDPPKPEEVEHHISRAIAVFLKAYRSEK